MYSYIVNELPSVIKSNFPNADTSRSSIMGHSMGGHGALVIGLRVCEELIIYFIYFQLIHIQ